MAILWRLLGFRSEVWPPHYCIVSLTIITCPKWRCLDFIVCRDTSWAITQTRRDCVFCFAGVQLVSMWRADELMKIDSNYVEPRLTARNDGEGSRILMRCVWYSPCPSWRHSTNKFFAFFIRNEIICLSVYFICITYLRPIFVRNVPDLCLFYSWFVTKAFSNSIYSVEWVNNLWTMNCKGYGRKRFLHGLWYYPNICISRDWINPWKSWSG
jgi:hypothetical protein